MAWRAGLRRVDSLTGGEIVGRKGGGDYSGILLPYFHPGSNQVRDYRLRRDRTDLEYDDDGSLKAKRKYLSAPGRSNMLYLPPGVSLSLLASDASRDHGGSSRLSPCGATLPSGFESTRFLPLGVSSVYNCGEQ